MNRGAWIAVIVVAVVLVGIVIATQIGSNITQGEAPAEQAAAEPTPKPPEKRYPLPEPDDEAEPQPAPADDAQQAEAAPPKPKPEPLPPLANSDQAVRSAVAKLDTGPKPLESFLVPDSVVRRMVVTVDNLDARPVSQRFRPVESVDGQMPVRRTGETILMDTANFTRYKPWVNTFTAMDADDAVDTYVRYYPLFQEAYEDAGYPDAYFNDRVIGLIDHLLATPAVTGPIELTQPKVFYQYADPDLERLSWGQKALIRMGPANAKAVKAQLRAIRAELVARSDPGENG